MAPHFYTDEEKAFFVEYVPGHSYKEIQAEFIKRFKWEITQSRISGFIARYGLNTGRTGQFEKGQVPHNKGKKGECPKGCEKGWFKKGHTPSNFKEAGTERLNVEGYIEIKTAEPNGWQLKHKWVWEQAYGKIPPKHCILHKDRDKTNNSLDNLVMISRNELIRMNKYNMLSDDPEITELSINTARLMNKIAEVKRNGKNKKQSGRPE